MKVYLQTRLPPQIAFQIALMAFSCSCSKVVDAPQPAEGRSIPPERVNVRSFDQMHETMSALTGIPIHNIAKTNQAESTFNGISGNGLRNQLPQGNSLKQFSAAQQGAIVQLAAPYCDAYVDKLLSNSAQMLEEKFPFMAGFSNSTSQDFTNSKIEKLTGSFYDHFWAACRNRPSIDETQNEISKLMAGLKIEFEDDSELNKPSNYIRVMCVAFLSSSCVSIY